MPINLTAATLKTRFKNQLSLDTKGAIATLLALGIIDKSEGFATLADLDDVTAKFLLRQWDALVRKIEEKVSK